MKKIAQLSFLIIILLVTIWSCSKKSSSDVTPANQFTYNSKSYALASAYTNNLQANSAKTLYLYETYFISSGLKFYSGGANAKDSLSGTGNGIYLQFVNTDPKLIDLGTYKYDTVSYSKNTFVYGEFLANVNLTTNTGDDGGEITGGTFTVTKNTPSLAFTFNLTTKSGKSISGNYTGSNTFYNYSYLKNNVAFKRTNLVSALNRQERLFQMR